LRLVRGHRRDDRRRRLRRLRAAPLGLRRRRFGAHGRRAHVAQLDRERRAAAGDRNAGQQLRGRAAADELREQRQLGVVDARGESASFTGSACFAWAGGRTGPGYAAQGNILVSGSTVDALAETFERSADGPLAERLIQSLRAGQAAGGDRRGQQSAALLVVRRDGGYAGLTDVAVDLRVDDHPTPITELERLYGLHQLYFGETPKDEWLRVDDELARELRERLARLGYREEHLGAAFRAWTGAENLEDRVDGIERIDPVVLEELRKR
jgi:uncharacterized Ntn-hydrolase superfamily protein